ncbi:hypothetical protein CEUSTIGMA_g10614.t1 [Chlamydomonas eustigma]|uniref:Major facilitator superfamily (MFS) profile domain-containing protein n=1 Tax=Chlamydomonas eustigma TaxID=1157962 RepID=A0A250XJE1_9CHLO|nr:hypothetical protein CEUSTIGMA_g10614.t1 [Chlamydomonas eustigma]|eukprot:GAX83188.1 hypothetical protein CEUSTIGMA_g10614.t1 [Chlamydomonas eustigma]
MTQETALAESPPSISQHSSDLSTSERFEDAKCQITYSETAPRSHEKSFYDIYTERQRYTILLIVAVAAIMVPFCDTIYLPALQAIESDLDASSSLVALSVAIYMFMVGASALVWGPASDRFGRKIIYLSATVFFIITSIVCIFSPNINVLIPFRALQGISVGAFLSVGGGALADVFPPSRRGGASGLFIISVLVGPIIGPLLGGALAQQYGWRSCFICLTMFAGVVILPMIYFTLPETHQHIKYQEVKKENPAEAEDFKEAAIIEARVPVFNAPWVPLGYLTELAVAPHAAVAMIVFGSYFAGLTELPVALAVEPYNLSISIIGLCYLPQGVGAFIAAPFFGRLSDRSATARPGLPESRLIHNTLAALLVMPPALLLYGWSLDYKTSLAASMIGEFLFGFGTGAYLPGILGYMSAVKQSAAGAGSAMVQAAMFITAGVLILVSSIVVDVIGFGPFFSILAGIQAVIGLFAYSIIWYKCKKYTPPATTQPSGDHKITLVTPAGKSEVVLVIPSSMSAEQK